MTASATSPKVSFRQLEEAQALVAVGNGDVRKMLNALGTSASIVTALIQFPGPKSDYQSAVRSAQAMMREASEVTSKIVTALGVDDKPWAHFRVFRLMTHAVADRWKTTAKEKGAPDPRIGDLLPVWLSLAREVTPEPDFEDPPNDEEVAQRIAVLDALRPVLHEIGKFDLFHPPGTAAEHARGVMVTAANEALQSMVAPTADERSRRQLRQALLRNAGYLYAASWLRHAEEVVDQLRALPPAEQQAHIAAHPDGLSLAPVDEGFRTAFAQLTELSHFMAHHADSRKLVTSAETELSQ